ncbi:MAG TPA: hypothetical protein PKN48_09360 [Bacteroidales bacterium]|nr:hypothetical protein [Bacteroidales bacterium]
MIIIFSIFVLVSLIAGIILIILVIRNKRRKKYKILDVNGKYVPMLESGRYIYREENTGALSAGVGDEYMLLDTEREAKQIIDEYHKLMK